MKNCYLDSNYLVYFKNESSPYHQKVIQTISDLILKHVNLFISHLVLDEFLYVFNYQLRKNKTKNRFVKLKKALKDVLDIPSLQLINPPLDFKLTIDLIDLMNDFSLSSRDAYHVFIMKTNQIDSFATFDNDFNTIFSAKFLHKV